MSESQTDVFPREHRGRVSLNKNECPLTQSMCDRDRIADITHVGLTCWGLGYERAVDVATWNAVTWGNVGFTVSHIALSYFAPYI